MISAHLKQLQEKIVVVCRRCGKNPDDIILIGVTKYADAPAIQEAIDSGLVHIGENRVQEAQRKFPELKCPAGQKIVKYLIGHLQTNKVKPALDLFDMIQSVDSVKLADEIQKQAEKTGRTVEVLVQVNTSAEEQKFGVDTDDVSGLVRHIASLPHIRLRGLMTIGPLTEDEAVLRACFRDLKNIFDQIATEYAAHETVEMKYLSMGMTNDFEIAIEEGANMIRVGRAIFTE